ncbi:hypothetical protein Tco_0738540 [Tanacetum coccineum]
MGLSVGSLKAFNYSLLLKWRWRMLNCPSALRVKVLKSIHGDTTGFDIKGCQSNGLWARIVGSIYHLHLSGYLPLNSFRYSVGDGSLIRFWKDTCSLDIDVGRDTPIFTLSTDNIYSVSVARKYLGECMLPSSLPCTRWYKISTLLRARFAMGLLSRIPMYSFLALQLLIFGATKDEKDRAYVIFASTCWTIWRFRNNIAFNSQVTRKCDIFDTIRLFSFSWYKFRGKNVLAGLIG